MASCCQRCCRCFLRRPPQHDMEERAALAGVLPAGGSRPSVAPSFMSARSETEAVAALKAENQRLRADLDDARLALDDLDRAQQRTHAELEEARRAGRDAERAKEILQKELESKLALDDLDRDQPRMQANLKEELPNVRPADLVVTEPSEEPPVELRTPVLAGTLPTSLTPGKDLRPSICRAEGVRHTLEALECKLAEVSSALPDADVAQVGVPEVESAAASPKVEIQNVLAGLKEARTSLADLEEVEKEVMALRTERESGFGLPTAVSDLTNELLCEIEECQRAAVEVSGAARALQNWVQRLGVLWPEEFACVELGLCFDRAASALRTAKTKCVALFERLLSVKSWCIDFMPQDALALEAYLAEKFGPSRQGVTLLSDWGSIPRGMHLVSVNDREIPLDATLGLFTHGQTFELKKGFILKFALPLPNKVTTRIQELLAALRSVSVMFDFKKAETLPTMSPATVPVARDMIDQRYVGPSMLKSLEARLVWEMELGDVERHVWKLVPRVSDLCEQADLSSAGEKRPVGLADPLPSAEESGNSPEPRKGKGKAPGAPPKSKSQGEGPVSTPKSGAAGGKGKGPGPPPPTTKGPAPSKAKGKCKGPGLPPAAKGKGSGKASGKGKGPGLPPPSASKGKPPAAGKGSDGHESQADTGDAVLQAAERRKNQPLFGKLTRRPDNTMLANQKRDFHTFVDRCGDELGIANIADAFGERGRLLLHACIAELPQKKEKVEKEKDLGPKTVQVIKGDEGPMGDKRRMDAEIRFRKLFPCSRGCAGRGLVIAPECSPCRRTHELAFAFASLDFDLLEQCAKLADLDLNAFVPALVIRENAEEDKAETEKVNQAFLLPEERQALAQFETQALQTAKGTRHLSVMELHSLERKLLPFVHVRSLAEKLKLYQISITHPVLEREAADAFQLVERACDAVRESSLLLDLLAVTLQIASYVKNFGDTDAQREGFSLLRLQYYQGFWIGKHPFLSVLSAFLMNLRPREKPKVIAEPGETQAQGNVVASSASSASSRAGMRASTRRQSKAPMPSSRAPMPSSKASARKPRGPSFMDKLDKDLADAREVCRSRLTLPQLEAHAHQFAQMAAYVERCFDSEAELFRPEVTAASEADAAEDSPAQAKLPEQRLAELVAWLGGRQRLRQLHERLLAAESRLLAYVEQVRTSERKLLEFAALKRDEFKSLGYLDVISAVVSFVDQLKQTWVRHEANPAELRELQLMLLAAAPLQMLFGTDCLEDAFNLWLTKAEAQEAAAKQWGESEKSEALRSLFQLFDTNADGSVDAEEMRVTLRAFGIQLPEGSELHYEVVRRFDGDGNGHLDLSEFRSFVEWRIQAAFRLFLQHRRPRVQSSETGQDDANGISEADLKRVAESLGCSGFPEETFAKMIHILDNAGQAKDGIVNDQEFEQLILMKPDAKVGRISSGHLLNQAINPSDRDRTGSTASDEPAESGRVTRRKSSRLFAWDENEVETLEASAAGEAAAPTSATAVEEPEAAPVAGGAAAATPSLEGDCTGGNPSESN